MGKLTMTNILTLATGRGLKDNRLVEIHESEVETFAKEEEDIVWITIGGRHIPIRGGDISEKGGKDKIKITPTEKPTIGKTTITRQEWKDATEDSMKGDAIREKIQVEDPELSDAVFSWTGPDYKRIRVAQNPQLERNYKTRGSEVKLTEQEKIKYKNYADKLEQLIKDAPKYEGEIYRNIEMGAEMKKKFDKFKKGTTVKTEAISSFTRDKTQQWGKQRIIVNKSKKGMFLGEISHQDKEEEVIMPKGVKLKYTRTSISKRDLGKGLIVTQTNYHFEEL